MEPGADRSKPLAQTPQHQKHGMPLTAKYCAFRIPHEHCRINLLSNFHQFPLISWGGFLGSLTIQCLTSCVSNYIKLPKKLHHHLQWWNSPRDPASASCHLSCARASSMSSPRRSSDRPGRGHIVSRGCRKDPQKVKSYVRNEPRWTEAADVPKPVAGNDLRC